MKLFGSLEEAIESGTAYHVWIVSYGISMGRNMWLAIHDGTFVNRVDVLAKGCTYWHGPLESGPWHLRLEHRRRIVAGESIPEARFHDRDGGFELVCESIRIADRHDSLIEVP